MDEYHPPHVVHAHAPHHEAPRPEVHPVHPDVIKAGEAAAKARQALAWSHPVMGLALSLVSLMPVAYVSLRMFREIGWFLIIPPALAAPLAVAGLIYLVESIALGIFAAVARPISRDWADWLDHTDIFVGPAVVLGVPIGFVLFLI